MRMDHIVRNEKNPYGGLWLNQIEQWEAAGKPGGLPPGLREGPPMPAGTRDYRPAKAAYLLRPEVCLSVLIIVLGAEVGTDIDCGELLPDVADDGRRSVARAWLGGIPGDRA